MIVTGPPRSTDRYHLTCPQRDRGIRSWKTCRISARCLHFRYMLLDKLISSLEFPLLRGKFSYWFNYCTFRSASDAVMEEHVVAIKLHN